jgi:hypothetical protein
LQEVHFVDPDNAEYVPASQKLQTADSGTLENLPGEHNSQELEPATEKLPMGQLIQLVDPNDAI